jgi:glycerol-3-phosphate acyltransferase PlsY
MISTGRGLMSAAALLYVVGAYLLGAIPTAYLAGRWRRGIDVRRVGSGNVGGSNLRATVGLWATVAVGLFDVAKGALPAWLGLRLGLDETVALPAGLAAVAGHDWSPWLGFQGGRRMASTLGVLLILFPVGLLWILGALALGALLHGLGVLTVPLLSLWLGQRAAVTLVGVALASLYVGFRGQRTLRRGELSHAGQRLRVCPRVEPVVVPPPHQ